jgi:DNA gyrase subunit A
MGRTARGVRGIKLRDDDYVVGVCVVDDAKELVTITENGFGKRTPFEDFRSMKHRGGFGVACHKIGDKTGKLVGIAAVSDDDDLMMITDSGTIVRTPAAGIPSYSRTAGGVIMMRLGDSQSIANFTVVAHEEAEEEVLDETSEQNVTEAAAEAVAENTLSEE